VRRTPAGTLPVGQLFRDRVEEIVDLALVVATLADVRSSEPDIPYLRGGDGVGIGQCVRQPPHEVVDLALRVTATPDAGVAELHGVDFLGGERHDTLPATVDE
jgi:hypothetical protein